MNIGLQFLNQIRGTEQDGTPSPDEIDPVKKLGGWVAQQITSLVASLTASYHKEHNSDDTHGTIHCTNISERGRSTPMGVWIDANIADAAAFTGSGTMTWTVPIASQLNSYMLVGTTMLLNVRIANSSVGGVLSQFLQLRIPGGFTVKRNANTTCLIYDANSSSAVVGQMRALTTAPTIVDFIRADGGNLSASASLTSVIGQIQFEVQ